MIDRLAGDDNLLEMLSSIPGQRTKIFIVHLSRNVLKKDGVRSYLKLGWDFPG